MSDYQPGAAATADEGAETEGPPRLTIPRLEVILDDGRVLIVQVYNADLVRLDRTAAKHRWPPTAQAPFLAQTFLAWSALRRTGEIPQDLTWEEFESTRALQVRDVPTNGKAPAEPETVAPFPAGAEGG